MALQHHSPLLQRVQVLSNGVAVEDVRLHTVVVEAGLNRLATAQVFVVDGDVGHRQFAASDDPRLAPGHRLEIRIGGGVESVTVFEGVVVRQTIRVNGAVGTLLCLELKHAAVAMSHLRRSAAHTQVRDTDLAVELARRAGLSLEGSFPIDYVHENLLQYHVSDWDFLVLRAEANGCCVATPPGSLRLLQPSVDATPALRLALATDVLEVDVERDQRRLYAGVEATAWSYERQDWERQDTEAAPPAEAPLLAPGPLRLGLPGPRSADELHAWASGRSLRSHLAHVCGRLRIRGHAGIQPGDTVALTGGSQTLAGTHFVSSVHHSWSAEGWTTDLEIGMEDSPYAAVYDVNDMPAAGLLSRIPGLQIGTVAQVMDDPGQQHRVLVKLPSIPDESEGLWARVASLDAGKGHGIFFRPQVGDEVVLGFLNEDPRDAIILGALFNASDHGPAFETDKSYAQQGVVTAAGLRLQLDETAEGILLQTPAGERIQLTGKTSGEQGLVLEDQFGNKIELGQQGITIHSAGSLTLEAATNLDIQASSNIGIAAKAKLNLSGTAQGELQSSGMLILKGTLININ